MAAPPPNPAEAPQLVEKMLADALRRSASDIHFEPSGDHYDIRFRIDGLLQTVETHDLPAGRTLVTRLMVMAHLLTYRLDVPQEGRLRISTPHGSSDARLAVIPTIHGLRAALRMPAEMLQPKTLDELSLPAATVAGLKDFAASDSGMLLLTGPAGSGKTTTIYALLAFLAKEIPGLSLVSLEDPVERQLSGITQIEVSPFGELTYERALRSILRQDPQVLVLGEIRDAATASLAVQAALSGHRLISTLHAANAGGAASRLLEMGVEPYQLASALWGVVSQRLLRRRSADGYAGRVPAAEFVRVDAAMRESILRRDDARAIEAVYRKQAGFESMLEGAGRLVAGKITDHAEVARVLGAR